MPIHYTSEFKTVIKNSRITLIHYFHLDTPIPTYRYSILQTPLSTQLISTPSIRLVRFELEEGEGEEATRGGGGWLGFGLEDRRQREKENEEEEGTTAVD